MYFVGSFSKRKNWTMYFCFIFRYKNENFAVPFSWFVVYTKIYTVYTVGWVLVITNKIVSRIECLQSHWLLSTEEHLFEENSN